MPAAIQRGARRGDVMKFMGEACQTRVRNKRETCGLRPDLVRFVSGNRPGGVIVATQGRNPQPVPSSVRRTALFT